MFCCDNLTVAKGNNSEFGTLHLDLSDASGCLKSIVRNWLFQVT